MKFNILTQKSTSSLYQEEIVIDCTLDEAIEFARNRYLVLVKSVEVHAHDWFYALFSISPLGKEINRA